MEDLVSQETVRASNDNKLWVVLRINKLKYMTQIILKMQHPQLEVLSDLFKVQNSQQPNRYRQKHKYVDIHIEKDG